MNRREEPKATTPWRHLPEPKARKGGGSHNNEHKHRAPSRQWLKAKPRLEHSANIRYTEFSDQEMNETLNR